MTQPWQRSAAFGIGNGHAALQQNGDDQIEEQLHQRLIRDLDEDVLRELDRGRARMQVERATRVLASELYPQLVGDAKEDAVAHVVDEVLGLGPIEPLLDDPSISEVMVNGPDEVFYERDGIIYESGVSFRDQPHIYRIIDRIVSAIGRHVDEASPMVDARLPDGSRVNIIIPPLTPKSPILTIRKFRGDRYRIEDLVATGTLSEGTAALLEACIRAKLNIVVSGGTGSGKTTLLNALSAFIPESERIVTIEDPIELKLQQRHVISAEARPTSIEGQGEVTQRDLVRNALRMRPDRIIVGEVRGAEAFDMMQAMNTGHEGSLTTVHANTPRDALARIENMVLMAGFDLPIAVIREQMASALHLMIQLSRLVDGSRRIVAVTEVSGMEGSLVTLQDIFAFKQTGIDLATGRVQGELRPTGIRPRFADRLNAYGVGISDDIFNVGRWG
jgi:pilus assembly protein CpaF